MVVVDVKRTKARRALVRRSAEREGGMSRFGMAHILGSFEPAPKSGNPTTKVTKFTKGFVFVKNLRVLRDLRGSYPD